jgi:hypothetical protein
LRRFLCTILFLSLVLLASCGYDEEKPIFMAPGSYGDIAVVVSNATMAGSLGPFENALNEEYVFVIKKETLFNIDVYRPAQWELCRNYKNIVFLWHVDHGGPVEGALRDLLTDAGEQKARSRSGALIEVESPFASYQHAVVLAATDRNSLLSYATGQAPGLRALFERESEKRIMRRYRYEGLNEQLMRDFWRKHRFFMEIPGSYRLNQDQPDGYPAVELIRNDPTRGLTIGWSHSVDPNLIIGHKPLLVELRKELGLKMHHEDIVESSLVWTQDTLGDQTVWRLEGAWTSRRIEGGGPFWAWFIADPDNQRIICIDALCYAPGTEKMDIFRRLRAIAQTFSLERPQP